MNKKVLIFIVVVFTVLQLAAQGGAAINSTGAAPDGSAGLDIQFSNKGILIPRMTTAERNAISNPAEGLQIFNTTTKCFEAYISPMWQSMFCGCTAPSTPVSGINTPAQAQIAWDWSDVSGAAGYQWNTVNTYPGTGINVVAGSAYTQNGLTCNTSYTLYVWAYNSCGYSSYLTLNETTSACPFVCGTSTVIFSYNGSSVTYGTTNGSYNGGQYCWLDRNLGAIAVATSYNHSASYGDLFQWGRLDDGHQLRSNNVKTTTLSAADVPGHSMFIIGQSSNYDWRSSQNDALWQGTSGINNPCPSGWRIPTSSEIDNERATWSQQNYSGAVNSLLHLPTAGCHYYNSGDLSYEAVYGFYWSSTVNSVNARRIAV